MTDSRSPYSVTAALSDLQKKYEDDAKAAEAAGLIAPPQLAANNWGPMQGPAPTVPGYTPEQLNKATPQAISTMMSHGAINPGSGMQGTVAIGNPAEMQDWLKWKLGPAGYANELRLADANAKRQWDLYTLPGIRNEPGGGGDSGRSSGY
jgi:hypothetical protein